MFGSKKQTKERKNNSRSMKVVTSKAKSENSLSKELKKLNTKKELKVGNEYIAKNKDGTFTVRTPIRGTNTYSRNWNEQTILSRLNKADYFEDVKRDLRPKPNAIKYGSSARSYNNGNKYYNNNGWRR